MSYFINQVQKATNEFFANDGLKKAFGDKYIEEFEELPSKVSSKEIKKNRRPKGKSRYGYDREHRKKEKQYRIISEEDLKPNPRSNFEIKLVKEDS